MRLRTALEFASSLEPILVLYGITVEAWLMKVRSAEPSAFNVVPTDHGALREIGSPVRSGPLELFYRPYRTSARALTLGTDRE